MAGMPFSEEATRVRAVRGIARALGLDQGNASSYTFTSIRAAGRLTAAEGGSLEERLVGCAVGTACGDVLGANLEFKSAEAIQQEYGRVKDFKHSSARPRGSFTDDTEMTGALMESIVACAGRVDAAHCARNYARHAVELPPTRGYGPSVIEGLKMLAEGADPAKTATVGFPEGSYGNGCLMRISVLGLLFRDSAPAELRRACEAALLCTHVHKEAVEASVLCATAAARLSRFRPDDTVLDLIEQLRADATVPEVANKLQQVLDAHKNELEDEELLDEVVEDVTYGRHFAVRASEALAVVLWALLKSGREPEECLIRTVNWGGDADTIGAVVGALLGCWHGTGWIPERWWMNIEDAEDTPDSGLGLTKLVRLAKDLAVVSPSCE
jgi:poly(ADP-ribose) glycohydrolase ARH3